MKFLTTPIKRSAIFKAAIFAVSPLTFVGCAGTADLKQSYDFSTQYHAGNYEKAIQAVGDYNKENLLSSLNVGSAQFAAGQFAESADSFTNAETQWQEVYGDSAIAKAGRTVGTILTNDLAAKYTGNIYEGTLLNTYKALSAIQLGDLDVALQEVNKSAERQKNARHQLGEKVKALNKKDEDTDDEKSKEYAEKIDSSVADSIKPDTELGKRLAIVEDLKQYDGLRNPLTDYLHGVFSLAIGDPNKASNWLRDAVALTDKKNSHVISDFALAEQAAEQISPLEPRVWVIYEDGIGPDLKEFRIDLPAFLVSNNLLYAGVAVPEFVPGRAANGDLKITASGQQIETEVVLETDRLVSTEFRIGYKRVVAKAISSAIVKSLIAYELNKQTEDKGLFGDIIKIVTTTTQAALTKADTRIWRGLPHTVGVASMEYPQDGVIVLQTGNGQTEEINLNALGHAGKHVIITAKAVNDEFVSWYAASL